MAERLEFREKVAGVLRRCYGTTQQPNYQVADDILALSEWQPIATAPRKGRIMLCDHDDEFYYPTIAEYCYDDPETGEPRFQGEGPSSTYDYWMPLPTPPVPPKYPY